MAMTAPMCPTLTNATPFIAHPLDRYVDRIERARQAAREAARRHIENILEEAGKDGLDQEMLRLMARERRMAHSLEKFLACRNTD
ncbi:MAG: hypothetical protein HQL76_17975 [Magnetococcales bacterium]|nr:hypothetical protein [Magnetococcales bacterium]